MSPILLERERLLAILDESLYEAADGNGHCVLVTGEAGIGKTSLIDHFTATHRTAARFFWGHCEALFTPRPLGPLHDIAPLLDGFTDILAEREGSRSVIFSRLLSALQEQAQPAVVILEDVHWADEATLDMIKYLGRRSQQASVLLIVTYRDDEIGADHPLRSVLGDLPSRTTKRLHIPPLSEGAVARLADEAQYSASDLYAITGGNPFFVTEVLAGNGEEIPETVRSAVLTRASRLSPSARAVLELAAVEPAKTELWLIATLPGEPSSAIDECLKTGMLHLDGDAVAFRHELARKAIESTLPPLRSKELHLRALHTLLARDDVSMYLARVVHHATRAGDGATVLQYTPEAARQAAIEGAHREAASYYRAALLYAAQLPAAQRAELLEGLAYQCYLTDQLDEALGARAEALAIWTNIGNLERIGHSQRWLSRLNWFQGRNTEADRYSVAAVATLRRLPPGRELAWAYSNLAQLRMLDDDLDGARHWGTMAIELAEILHDEEVRCHALNNVGAAEMPVGGTEGHARLAESLRIALEHGFEEHAARAYTNLTSRAVAMRDYPGAIRYFDEGIAYCAEHDLDSWRLYMTGWQARARLETGDWIAAAEDANIVLRGHRASPVVRISALVVLGCLRLRYGDSGSAALLDEARDLASQTEELQRIVPVAAARAEGAWLRGERETCLAEARVGFELALNYPGTAEFGQMCFWMWKAGELSELPDGLPEPYASQLRGDWRHAADLWAQLGCPYEQALALADGDSQAQQEALTIFRGLGARATADYLARQLHAAGVQGIPRGPRASTQSNPAGLTDRQLEVLLLLAEGLSTSEIAVKLSAAPKTIEHHISSILAKLHAKSRTQAIAAAYSLGAIPRTR